MLINLAENNIRFVVQHIAAKGKGKDQYRSLDDARSRRSVKSLRIGVWGTDLRQ